MFSGGWLMCAGDAGLALDLKIFDAGFVPDSPAQSRQLVSTLDSSQPLPSPTSLIL